MRPRAVRGLYLALGCVCVALGAAGAVLPLLPATPFLLLGAWAFARSSPQLHARLYAHPRYGRLLRAWNEERAIPRGAKLAAVVMLAASWAVTALAIGGVVVPAVAAVFMLAVAGFVLSRPSPRRAPQAACGGSPAPPPE